MIDLNPNHLKTVESILAEHVPDCEVRAFGSRVNWTANDHSDLDLAVCGDSPLSLEVMGNLKEAFEESDLPIRVDVLDWHQTSDTFKKVIENHYKQIQTKSNNQPPTTCTAPAQEWKTTTIGEIAPFTYGRGLPARKRNPNGTVAVYGSNGVVGWHDTALTKGPTVIVGRKGSAGSVHYSPAPCWPIDTAFYIEGDDPELTRFKYYLLQSLGLDRMNSDSAVPGLNRNNAHALEVQVPEIEDQRMISRILGTLDDKIELNRRRCETLEEMARALFKSWFIDFGPVRAKAEGRETGLPKHLTDLFPDCLEESELGPIPTGWSIRYLSEIANHLRKTENPRTSPIEIFTHFSIPSYDNGQTPVQQYGNLIKSHKIIVPPETVLISRLNPETERTWLVDVKSSQRAVCSTEFLVLNPIKPFTCSYVYCLARSKAFRNQLISLVTGTSKSHQRAPVKSVMDIRVATPPKNLLVTFREYSEKLLKKQQALRNAIPILAALRDELIPRLISGELHVKSR